MSKPIKHLLVLVFLVFCLALYGVLLTFAVFSVRTSNHYANLQTNQILGCGPELRDKIISYSQNGDASTALTETEDQIFRFQIKAQVLGPMLNTLTYFHNFYLNQAQTPVDPQVLAALNDYLIEEKELTQNVLNELKQDSLPNQLETCRQAIISSWEEALLLANGVLVSPQEQQKEKYESFSAKNQIALEVCQKEASKLINLPQINNADLISLSQPLACLLSDSTLKSQWQKQGDSFYQAEGLEEMENILAEKKYHPLLAKYFMTWRSAKQLAEYGSDIYNKIPNQFYDEKRLEVYETIKQHLAMNPRDAWAKLQLVEIVNLADIVRSEKGNSVLDYYHFDTGQDIE